MTKAIEINFNTRGILLFSDDLLLKFWHLDHLDKNKIWFPSKVKIGMKTEYDKKIIFWFRSVLRKNKNGIINFLKFLDDVEYDKNITQSYPGIKNYPG